MSTQPSLAEEISRLTLIVTLQAGFYYGMALEQQHLGALINKGQETILRMDDSEMTEAVTGPAERVGLSFEKGLAEDIVAEAGQVNHPLPLVQESLRLLWNEEKSIGSLPLLTHETYRDRIGGVAGAIQRRATEVYNNLSSDEQETAKHVFTRLVHYGEGDEGNALQKLLLSDLVTQKQEFEAVQRVTKKLADERLLATGEETDAETQTVEIIHRILIEEWDKLRGWIEEQEGLLLWLQKLNERLEEWEEQEFDEDLLLRGPLLAEAVAWQDTSPDELSARQMGYIEHSIAAQKEEEKQRREAQIIRRIALVIGVLAVAFLAAALLAYVQRTEAVEARATSESNAALAATSQAKAQLNEAVAQTEEAQAQVETTRAIEAEATATVGFATAVAAQIQAKENENIAATRAVEAQNAQAEAVTERAEAERQSRVAIVNALAGQAPGLLDVPGGDPELAILLMMEAHAMDSELGSGSKSIVDSAMREILSHPYLSIVFNESTDRVRSVSLSPDGNYLAASQESGGVRIWDLTSDVIDSSVMGEDQSYTDEVGVTRPMERPWHLLTTAQQLIYGMLKQCQS